MSPTVCGTMKQFCKDPSYSKNLQMMCPITCQMECFSKKDLEDAIGRPELTNVPQVLPSGNRPQYQTPFANQQGPATTPANKVCKDFNSNCAFMSVMCNSKPRIKEMCPVTCNACGNDDEVVTQTTTAASPPDGDQCQDKMPGCPTMKNFCQAPTYQKQMAANCAKTCGLCGVPGAPKTTS